MKNTRLLWLAAVALSFVACSGGGNVSSVSVPTSSLPAVSPPTTPQSSSARFVIRVPATTRAASTIRKPAYVAPATKSVSIVANGSTTPVIANLTPASPGCTAATSTTPLTCTVSAPAPAGNDTFVLTMYDQPGATGNKLSNATVAVTIVRSQANTVPVTMDGIIAAIALVLAQPNPPVGSPADIALTVNAMDADGNIIVGPGSYHNGPITVGVDSNSVLFIQRPEVPDPSYALTAHYDGSNVTRITFSATTSGDGTSIQTSGNQDAILAPTYPVLPNPSSLAFETVGNASAQNFSVSETNYGGTFSAPSCGDGSVATVSTTDNLNFSVTPVTTGSCSITISDGANRTAQITVTVGTTSINLQSKTHRVH